MKARTVISLWIVLLLTLGVNPMMGFAQGDLGQHVRTLQGHTSIARSVVFSPDSRTLASAPFVTRAQEPPINTEARASAADGNAGTLAATTAAEQAAAADFKPVRLHWLCGGFAAIYVGACAGCFIGCLADPLESDPGGLVPLPSGGDLMVPGTCIGLAAGGVGAFIAANAYSPPATLPAQLLGKSPEYIATYTEAYTKKKRELRRTSAVTGAAAGLGVMGCLVAWTLLQ